VTEQNISTTIRAHQSPPGFFKRIRVDLHIISEAIKHIFEFYIVNYVKFKALDLSLAG